jgi:hypothetical protein
VDFCAAAQRHSPASRKPENLPTANDCVGWMPVHVDEAARLLQICNRVNTKAPSGRPKAADV